MVGLFEQAARKLPVVYGLAQYQTYEEVKRENHFIVLFPRN